MPAHAGFVKPKNRPARFIPPSGVRLSPVRAGCPDKSLHVRVRRPRDHRQYSHNRRIPARQGYTLSGSLAPETFT
ncbi:MAG: hypothetical protein WC295_13875 [Methanoregula sp.]